MRNNLNSVSDLFATPMSLPRVLLQRFVALGQQRDAFEVLGHTLPASAKIDGLLGLDFMRGQTLTVDFRLGQVRLE